MGADYPGQEIGIEQLRAMPEEAREYLCHHLRNSLTVIIGHASLLRCREISIAAEHIVHDLEQAGIAPQRAAKSQREVGDGN